VVFVITLIVVGPHRFPGIARQAGHYYRMARRYASEVTADVRGAISELEAEVETNKSEFEDVSTTLSEGLTATVDETRGELEALGGSTQAAVGDPAAAATGAGNGATPAPAAPTPPASNAASTSTTAGGSGLITPRELPGDDADIESTAERPADGE